MSNLKLYGAITVVILGLIVSMFVPTGSFTGMVVGYSWSRQVVINNCKTKLGRGISVPDGAIEVFPDVRDFKDSWGGVYKYYTRETCNELATIKVFEGQSRNIPITVVFAGKNQKIVEDNYTFYVDLKDWKGDVHKMATYHGQWISLFAGDRGTAHTNIWGNVLSFEVVAPIDLTQFKSKETK